MKLKKYLPVIILLILGGFIALTGIKKSTTAQEKPEKLFLDIIERTRFYSVEDVAHQIISKDPTLQLIDVRNESFYNKFSLKGAMNIPLKDILKPENLEYFDQDVYNTVLFSNGTSDADVAWIILTRLGYENVFVMKGGLNRWVENILQPEEQSVIWDRVSDQLYQYRKGASQYFGGKAVEANDKSSAPKIRKPIKKRKKKEVEGGCS